MKAADARAAHAALVERALALEGEVVRLEEAARDLEQRIAARAAELEQARSRREALLQAVAEETRTLDDDVRALDALRTDVRVADEAATTVRGAVDGQDAVIRDARRGLDEIRAQAGELDLARATAQSDLGHLAQMCVETVQCCARPGAGGRRGDGAGGRDDARRGRDHAPKNRIPKPEEGGCGP